MDLEARGPFIRQRNSTRGRKRECSAASSSKSSSRMHCVDREEICFSDASSSLLRSRPRALRENASFELSSLLFFFQLSPLSLSRVQQQRQRRQQGARCWCCVCVWRNVRVADLLWLGGPVLPCTLNNTFFLSLVTFLCLARCMRTRQGLARLCPSLPSTTSYHSNKADRRLHASWGNRSIDRPELLTNFATTRNGSSQQNPP